MIDDDVIGRVNEDKIDDLIEKAKNNDNVIKYIYLETQVRFH